MGLVKATNKNGHTCIVCVETGMVYGRTQDGEISVALLDDLVLGEENSEAIWDALLKMCEPKAATTFADYQVEIFAEALVNDASRRVSGWVQAQNMERMTKMPGVYLLELFAKTLGEAIAKHTKK